MSTNDNKNNPKEEVLLFVVDALKAHEREMDRLIQKLETVKNILLANLEKQKTP
jgi:hypothetical protein